MMFNIEYVIKGIALIVAIGLLLSSLDLSYLLAKLSIKQDASVDHPVIPTSGSFLKTLELWYLLKKQCDDCELMSASAKLDEVFPLLNDNIEEKK